MLDGLLEGGGELAAEGVEGAGDGDGQLAHDVLQGGVVHLKVRRSHHHCGTTPPAHLITLGLC